MDVERCWLLTGKLQKPLWAAEQWYLGKGTPTEVSFDYDSILKREDEYKDVLGFFHTHPTFPANYSQRDLATMEAWVLCLGKPLLCVIEGIDGLKGYWFFSDGQEPKECVTKLFDNLLIGTSFQSKIIGLEKE